MINISHPLSRTVCGLFCLLVLLAVPAAVAQTPPSFDKAFSPSTIGPGSVSTLRFDIVNPSSVGIRNLAFSDTLPAGMTIAAPANAASTCLGGNLSAPEGGSTISYSGGGIGSSSSCAITVDVTSATPGTHTNTSDDLTSDAGNSGPATADLTVATDRPGFTKAFSPASVAFGARSTLTFTIDNTANDAAASQLNFVDELPLGMEIASPANASTTCDGGTVSAPAGGTVISYGFAFIGDASVAAGSTCTVSVDVLANSVGSLGNTSDELFSSESFGQPRSSGKAGAILTVTVDRLSLTKSFVDDPVPPGATVTLQFSITNLDRSNGATGLAFTDDLDAVLSGLVATGTPLSDPCGSGSTLTGTSVLTFSGGSLGPGASCTFSVPLQVPAGAATGAYTNTTSQLSGDLGGRPATGAAASDLLFVAPVPILTKEFVDDPVGSGGSVTLELSITNTSQTQPASDISFEDAFDAIVTAASSLPASGFCGVSATASFIPATGGNPARLLIADAGLEPGETCTFSVVLDLAVGASTGVYPNTTSEITATVDGQVVTGSPASDDLQVAGGPELVKEFTDDPVSPGDTVTLELTLTHPEDGLGDATDITFTDDLDATLSGLVATGLPMTDVCGVGSEIAGTSTLTFSGGSLTPGESCTFAVTLQVPGTAPAGSHPNTTSNVMSTVVGATVVGSGASDDLEIGGVTLAKEFTDDPVLPGGTATLRFTLENVHPTEGATGITFGDDLDDALTGMESVSGSLADVCGTGSQVTGTDQLSFTGGELGPTSSCTFDVTVQVPLDAAPGVYQNRTSEVEAIVGGNLAIFDAATDLLTVSNEVLDLTKEFTDDPVAPGGAVTLRFTLTNLSATDPVADLAFTDDLDAALSGLVSTSGTLSGVCGTGSQVSGSSVLTFTGGSLAAGGSCSFDVTLMVPSTVSLGSSAVNTTSELTGTLGGLPVIGLPASDTLRVDFVVFTKTFGGDAIPGGTVTLTFHLENLNGSEQVTGLAFTDDLSGVIPGLVATGLPAVDVCGLGSVLDGTSFLLLTNANLLPGGSCSFSVTLEVPPSAVPGSYLNTTSELEADGLRVAEPATATLTVVEADSDGDGVLDDVDVCPGTVIPEGVPTVRLGTNRYALVDGDGIFDTTPPRGNGNGPGETFTIDDTAGCSCEQIIAAQGLGQGHVKFGCSLGEMREWVDLVNP